MKDRKEQMKDITRKQRLAIVGMFMVLLALILCLIGATFVIWQMVGLTNRNVYESNLYHEASYQLLLENFLLHEYILQPSADNQHAFLTAYQQSLALFRTIVAVGEADDIAAVKPIITEQGHYFATAEHLFALVNANNPTQASAFYNTAIDPLFDTMIGQLAGEAKVNYDTATQNLVQMGAILRLGFTTIILVFVFGIILILLFLRILRRAQRQQYAMELAEQDMLRVANVQLHLLPRELPTVSGLEMYARCHPAQQVGGDLYTFDRHASGQCVLTIGDVSGKGLRAALLMAMMRTIIHVTVHALLQLEPKAIASKANESLYDDFTEVGMFATIFVSCYDPDTQRLAYTNAGHSPVIYCPADGTARFLDADVPMIGVLPILPTKDTVISLGPGDVLVMATDGLSEAHNADGEMFGYERLLTLVKSLQQESAQNIAEALFEAVNGFASDCEQFDDQTLVVMKGVER